MKFSPAIKGLITAAAMISVALVTYYSGLPANSPVQYLVFAFYALGIIWTLMSFQKTPAFTGKFGESFQQGFRCFIVVTLTMVLFTGAFSMTHPEFAEQSAVQYKKELEEKKDTLPTDIDTQVASYKKGYTMALVYGAIISYLIMGAGVTAVGAALLTSRKK